MDGHVLNYKLIGKGPWNVTWPLHVAVSPWRLKTIMSSTLSYHDPLISSKKIYLNVKTLGPTHIPCIYHILFMTKKIKASYSHHIQTFLPLKLYSNTIFQFSPLEYIQVGAILVSPSWFKLLLEPSVSSHQFCCNSKLVGYLQHVTQSTHV